MLSEDQLIEKWGFVFEIIATDKTERKRLEEENLKKEKLVGVLETTGAVCHELNQPLQAILGYSDLLKIEAKDNSKIAERAKKIKDQTENLANIIKKLSTVSKYKTKSYLSNKKILDIDKASIKPVV